MVETTDRQTDRRERESGYTIDPDDISRCRQDQKAPYIRLVADKNCYPQTENKKQSFFSIPPIPPKKSRIFYASNKNIKHSKQYGQGCIIGLLGIFYPGDIN